MRERLRHLAFAQKIVVVIGLAVALFFVGEYVVWREYAPNSGWFGYAPQTLRGYGPGARHPLWRVIVPLVLVAVWTACSVWLLGPRGGAEDGGE